MFDHPEFADHEWVTHVADPTRGLFAIIAIHSTALGPGGGGVRMYPYRSPADALTDALRLSRGMTYKAAMGGLPFGGAKTVVIGDPRTKTDDMLEALGDAIEMLGGRYFCGEDVGTTPEDMAIIARRTSHVVGLPGRSGDPSPATARGVFVAIVRAVETVMGRPSLAGVRVAVQGAGHVGAHLVTLLVEAGADVTIADIEEQRVAELRRSHGVDAVEPDRIHAVETDVFSPCALGAVIDDSTIEDLKARIVCGSANNQLAEPRHGLSLHQRGVVYVPDYVASVGGAISAMRERAQYGPGEFDRRIEAIGDRVVDILERSARSGQPPSVAADTIAAELVATATAAR